MSNDKKETIARYGISTFADLVTLYTSGIPLGTASAAILDLIRGRLNVGRDVLLDELARGETLPADLSADAAISIIDRYLRAAREGAARQNLRLMARVVKGQVKVYGNLAADEFLHYADIISSLTHKEIIFLAVMWKHWQSLIDAPIYINPTANPTQRWLDAHEAAVPELVGEGRLFASVDELRATSAALIRTGFLILSQDMTSVDVVFSPAMSDFAKLAGIETFEPEAPGTTE